MEQVTNLLIKSSKKHIEYFKKKITPNGIIILQEFHSTSNYEINWKDVLTTAAISITEKQILAVLWQPFINICIKNKLMDKDSRILILGNEIEDLEVILINFYNANTETKQYS